MDIVEAVNTLIQERQSPSDSCITIKASGRSQKVVIFLANEGPGLTCFNIDLRQIFAKNVGNEFGALLRGKGPHKTEFAPDFVRMRPLMIYTDLIGYNIVGDTKAPLMRCFCFLPKLKAREIITIGQNVISQAFRTHKSDCCSKFLLIVFTLTWETRAAKKHLLYLSVSLLSPLILMFGKASNIHF